MNFNSRNLSLEIFGNYADLVINILIKKYIYDFTIFLKLLNIYNILKTIQL